MTRHAVGGGVGQRLRLAHAPDLKGEEPRGGDHAHSRGAGDQLPQHDAHRASFAGLAGAGEISGTSGYLSPGVFVSIGFDSIAIALLARANALAAARIPLDDDQPKEDGR